jgi:hypothetical protein
MQFHNLQTIDELLSLAAINKDNPVVVIEDRIIDWLVSLRETITYGTRRTYLAALTTFYEINDINIRKKRIARFLGQKSTRKYKIGHIPPRNTQDIRFCGYSVKSFSLAFSVIWHKNRCCIRVKD